MRTTSKAVRARMIQGVTKTRRTPAPTVATHSHVSSSRFPSQKTSPRFSGGMKKYQSGEVTNESATDQSTTATMKRPRPIGKLKKSR
jgi:hypothetical protein